MDLAVGAPYGSVRESVRPPGALRTGGHFPALRECRGGVGGPAECLGGEARIDEAPEPDTPINEVSSGEAFSLARDAISRLDKERRKYPLCTMIRCGDHEVERTLNVVYMLTDSLLLGRSDRQWETVKVYEETGRLDASAVRLGVKSESTVSRNLHRGYYWQLLDARRELRSILQSHFAS